ncbi:hypothetical protein TorRG33x02_256280 [Trema orientale]|uniref:Uncharacterized protein n=1 Tax=Trema orientale TaxID=63057 RepID=A0A2P5DBP2_TREOI|nr:hypothetical protein TorRG33x02_256280 [Trema orientale]
MCLSESVVAITWPGRPLPSSIPAAFFRYQVTDGDLTVNSNVLSLKAVIVTAIGVSGLYFWVLALKSLQNAIKFNLYCPSAGPTGGAGRAPPAGTVKRIVADTGRRVRISFKVAIDFALTAEKNGQFFAF